MTKAITACMLSLLLCACSDSREGKLRISARQSDQDIRETLLAHTPLGTSYSNGMDFIATRLFTHKVTTCPDVDARLAFAILDSYSDFPIPMILSAEWKFSMQSGLVTIQVRRVKGSL